MLVRMCDFGSDVIISDLTLLAIAALAHKTNAALMPMGHVLSVTVGIYRFGLGKETPQMHKDDVVLCVESVAPNVQRWFFPVQVVARTMALPCGRNLAPTEHDSCKQEFMHETAGCFEIDNLPCTDSHRK